MIVSENKTTGKSMSRKLYTDLSPTQKKHANKPKFSQFTVKWAKVEIHDLKPTMHPCKRSKYLYHPKRGSFRGPARASTWSSVQSSTEDENIVYSFWSVECLNQNLTVALFSAYFFRIFFIVVVPDNNTTQGNVNPGQVLLVPEMQRNKSNKQGEQDCPVGQTSHAIRAQEENLIMASQVVQECTKNSGCKLVSDGANQTGSLTDSSDDEDCGRKKQDFDAFTNSDEECNVKTGFTEGDNACAITEGGTTNTNRASSAKETESQDDLSSDADRAKTAMPLTFDNEQGVQKSRATRTTGILKTPQMNPEHKEGETVQANTGNADSAQDSASRNKSKRVRFSFEPNGAKVENGSSTKPNDDDSIPEKVEFLFSDEEADDNVLGNGVSQQISQIEAKLKNDRLRTSRKRKYSPVV